MSDNEDEFESADEELQNQGNSISKDRKQTATTSVSKSGKSLTKTLKEDTKQENENKNNARSTKSKVKSKHVETTQVKQDKDNHRNALDKPIKPKTTKKTKPLMKIDKSKSKDKNDKTTLNVNENTEENVESIRTIDESSAAAMDSSNSHTLTDTVEARLKEEEAVTTSDNTISSDSSHGTVDNTTVTTQPNKSDVPAPESNKKQETSSWGSWGNWGASLISVASNSVSTFTSQVEDGWNTMLETVESSLGAPSPEELAKIEKEEEQQNEESETKEDESEETGEEGTKAKGETKAKEGFWSSFGIQEFDDISNLTSLVTDKGKKLVSGGLDVLETIGKKTYDVVTLTDPAFKNTRNALSPRGNRPNLSQILREAKDSANHRPEHDEEFEETNHSNQANFSAMFDEYQGLAHLEALEMLSAQSERKVQMLMSSMDSDASDDCQSLLDELRTEFDWEELSQDEDDDDDKDHDFSGLVSEHMAKLQLTNPPDKLTDVQNKIRHWLDAFILKEPYENEQSTQAKEVHLMAVQSLAELTSRSMEQFHKTAELILLQKGDVSVIHQATTLASLTKVLCAEVGMLSTRFTRCLTQIAAESEDSDLIHPLMTIVYLEASNSSTYVHDAFQLLHPVLQQALLDRQGT